MPEPAAAPVLSLAERVLQRNDELAQANHRRFRERGVVALNVMSGPGAGKTTLLERLLRDLGGELDITVIEGDQATDHDAARIRAAGGRALQINTGTGCHLDAAMVARALDALDPAPGSVVIGENVGNLVCPAQFDLGEDARIVVVAVTDGDDKPLKYPHMFRGADLLLLNKIDLLPYVRFDPARCAGYAREVNPRIEALEIAATRGDGLDAWYAWLRARVAALRRSVTTTP
ncbi:MAG TPA: hydrogenase nickel incorporation protein HypB [Terriglobales bacterium]|nr:hydrogenase nickel incorporation protein HypB [Terriglobales bacterium]